MEQHHEELKYSVDLNFFELLSQDLFELDLQCRSLLCICIAIQAFWYLVD